MAYDILSRIVPFRGIAETAANHHEKLDGSGYHRGLKADRLDLPSHILAVTDIYDALTQERSYRGALPKEKALEILAAESGRGLCPTCVAAIDELAGEEAI